MNFFRRLFKRPTRNELWDRIDRLQSENNLLWGLFDAVAYLHAVEREHPGQYHIINMQKKSVDVLLKELEELRDAKRNDETVE